MSKGARLAHRTRIVRHAGLGLLCCLLVSRAHADAWLDAGDAALRHHVEYLVDSGVIDLPLGAWPIPSVDVAVALGKVDRGAALPAKYLPSLNYVERRIDELSRSATRLRAHASGAARPLVIRAFEDTPRAEGELGADFTAAGERFSGRLSVQLVGNPDDDKSARLDGTYGTVRLGNWLVTAGALDRWWGPGWEGSLLLSNNARPVPAISLDRESSQPFRTPWLSWIGPWRLTTFMGKMEEHRQDRDHPLLFGMRITARPFSNLRLGPILPLRGIEFALERTAQWCGEGLPCDLHAFGNVFAGNDNAGETVDPEEEPGNQLAGWTLRYASPFPEVPLAVYRQKTGETIDMDSPLPRRTLSLYGAETWGSLSRGYTWRLHAEYADTACSPRPGEHDRSFDCAYNNGLFNVEGYRYRGRPVGYSADGDSLARSLGILLTTPSDQVASLLVRKIQINRGGGIPDLKHSLADRPTELWNVETSLAMPTDRGSWRIGLGADQLEDIATGRRERLVRGFLRWDLQF
jgi:hypothetical protein